MRPSLALLVSMIVAVGVVVYALLLAYLPETPPRRVELATGVVTENYVLLPLPRPISNVSVEEAILRRRSIRDYTEEPVLLEHLSLILWAAQGITDPVYKLRAAPSAGATYPLEVYVVVGERGVLVRDGVYLRAGVYKYLVHEHALLLIKSGDFRAELERAALDQRWVGSAPVSIVITAVYERTTARYGERGAARYVPMEAGHAGQNIYLMATALGYGTVAVGAFYDHMVLEIVGASEKETPLYIYPIGVPQRPVTTRFEDIWSVIERARGVGA
jgi:SagB-type dehydrogenase family enzyme